MNHSTPSQTWRRKRNRLERVVYRGPGVFATNARTWQGQRVFVSAAEVHEYRTILEDTARTAGFRLLAYCFMPDHLHLLVEGSEGSDLARLMKTFKQVTSFRHKRRTGRLLWQRSYYDSVLRKSDELRPDVEYILANPVRAGLVEEPGAYPFSGGDMVEEMLVAT